MVVLSLPSYRCHRIDELHMFHRPSRVGGGGGQVKRNKVDEKRRREEGE